MLYTTSSSFIQQGYPIETENRKAACIIVLDEKEFRSESVNESMRERKPWIRGAMNQEEGVVK